MFHASSAVLTIVALLCTVPARASEAAVAGAPTGAVSGSVIDESGGLLPGVTVTATSADGRLLGLTVTDAVGEYAFPALPTGATTLGFELGGFATITTRVDIHAGAEAQVVERLNLAMLSETVEVVGIIPPQPPPVSLPPRREPPVIVPVRVTERDSICGPAKPAATQESLGTIASGRDDTLDRLYTTGSQLLIHGGLDHGLEVGRNLVARRVYRVEGEQPADALREHSAGLLQIVEAGEHASVAVVVYACDELRKGDFLVSFEQGEAPAPHTLAPPNFREAARILFADEGQRLGSPRRLMVIGRGTEQGAAVGQHVTLFRQRPGFRDPDVVGDAVIVSVRADSSTIRVERVTDAVAAGDWAAPDALPALVLSQR